jgi:excinuclease UvrABC nuclease subunit
VRVLELIPPPSDSESFHRNRLRFIPSCSACYALTNFGDDILYIGRASDLRRRVEQHLDTPAKRQVTPQGRAVKVHWFATLELAKVERTWINSHQITEGYLPCMNRINPPIST